MIRKLSESPDDAYVYDMTAQLKTIVNFIELTNILGQEVKATHLPEHRALIQNLGEIAEAVQKALKSNPAGSKADFVELQKEIAAFIAAHP